MAQEGSGTEKVPGQEGVPLRRITFLDNQYGGRP